MAHTKELNDMAFKALSIIQDGATAANVQHEIGGIFVSFNAIGMTIGVWIIAPLSDPAQVETTTSVTEAEKLLSAFINPESEGELSHATDGI